MFFDRSNALYDKVSNKPIDTGSKVAGSLWFLFPGAEVADMRKGGTKYTLSVEDVNSHAWQAEFTLPKEASPDAKYYPGISSLPEK